MSLPTNTNLFKHFGNQNNILVETGSWRGDGIQAGIEAGFNIIHSIDIDKQSIDFCHSRFDLNNLNQDKIKLYYGDSSKILYDVIKDINEPITFWLDAHSQLLEGEPEYETKFPLLKEIDQISNHHIKNHMIIIDDLLHLTHPDITGWTREGIKYFIREKINPNYCFELIANPVKNNILIAYV